MSDNWSRLRKVAMSDHRHATHEPGCYRCELSADEVNPAFDVPGLDPDVFWSKPEPERDYSGERGL